MSVPEVVAPGTTGRVVVLVVSVFVLGVTLTWSFLSMRVVMDVWGSCADGGPYVSAQPCPGGAGIIGLAIPLMLLAAFAGTFAAASLPAPNLLLPMWFLLFAALGWNFLEYGVTADGAPVWGFVICGVVFEAMAWPALYFVWAELKPAIVPQPGFSDKSGLLRWWTIYPVLGAVGAVVGIVTFHAMA